MSPEFVLIGNPVAHSLSPAMHNALYQELGKVKWPFSRWHYSAVRCENAQDAREQINLVRTGRYRGMNITMPWKKLAFDNADFADAAVVAAGGANVLVRDEDLKLCAYNTDGLGAVRAIERVTANRSRMPACSYAARARHPLPSPPRPRRRVPPRSRFSRATRQRHCLA